MQQENNIAESRPAWRRFLSNDSGPFAQFVKYGAIGVAATLVQMTVFYVLASTCCRCLGANDWAVEWFGLPSVELSRLVRGFRFWMFFGAAAGAMTLATGISWMLIHLAGLQTTIALLIEVVVSFLVNFIARKFFIFKG